MTVGPGRSALEETRAWARATRLPDGRRVIDQPWVQTNLARVKAGARGAAAGQLEAGVGLTHGELNYADASAVKVFGSEFYVEAYRLLLEVLGARRAP